MSRFKGRYYFVLMILFGLALEAAIPFAHAVPCDFKIITASLFSKQKDIEYNRALESSIKDISQVQLSNQVEKMIGDYQQFSPSFPKEEFLDFAKTQDLARLQSESKNMGEFLGKIHEKFSPEFEKIREAKLANLDGEIKEIADESKRIVNTCTTSVCVAEETEKLGAKLVDQGGFFGCFKRHPEAFQNMLKDLAFSWSAMAVNSYQKGAKWQDFPFEYMAAGLVLGPTIGAVNCRKFYNESKNPAVKVEYEKNVAGKIKELSSRTWSYMRWYPISAATGSAFSYVADKIRGKKNQSGAYYFWKGVYFMSYSMIETPIRKALIADPLFQKGMPAFNSWLVNRGMSTVAARSTREAAELGSRFLINFGKNYLRAEMNNQFDPILIYFGKGDLIPKKEDKKNPKVVSGLPPSKDELKKTASDLDAIESAQQKH